MREKLIDICKQANDELRLRCGASTWGDFVDILIANDVVPVVRCKDCKHWIHMEDGFGDCTNGRFHLDGYADPTMKADDFCSCGERREGE